MFLLNFFLKYSIYDLEFNCIIESETRNNIEFDSMDDLNEYIEKNNIQNKECNRPLSSKFWGFEGIEHKKMIYLVHEILNT